MAKVGIVMGSDSDMPIMSKAAAILDKLGIDYEMKDNWLNIEIMLGEAMTHTIKNVRKVQINFSLDEINDGLDITDYEGKTTILRFEN